MTVIDFFRAVDDAVNLPPGRASEELILLLDSVADVLNNCGDLGVFESRTHLYCAGVTVRGILDWIYLNSIISSPSWATSSVLQEGGWRFLHDCADRIEAFPGSLDSPILSHIRNSLESIRQCYLLNHGEGIYLSHDIAVKKRLCTICDQNVKLCNHIPGVVYDGSLCQERIVDFEIRSISLVANPADPRCRVWPWNYNQVENTFHAPVLVLFALDDFIRDSEWKNDIVSRFSEMGLRL